jgi:hypothetical protein
MGVRPDGKAFDWLPIFLIFKKWLIKFVLVLLGMIKELKNEKSNSHISQKNDSHFVANKDSRILICNTRILAVK